MILPALLGGFSTADLWPLEVNAAGTSKRVPGLRVTYKGGSGDDHPATDIAIRPNLWLYVPANQPPTPFLPPGRFTASWHGFVSLDLRSEYRFQAELNGELKLEINGNLVLEASSTGREPAAGPSIRLNKGTNAIAATFRSPPAGDAFLRVTWTPKGGLPAPIPTSALSHFPDDDSEKAAKVRLGRALFLEYRCFKCHPTGPGMPSGPEFESDAPSFEGIGSRRNSAWIAKWILDPRARRDSARMPSIFHGSQAQADAQAAAAFLASLKDASIDSSDAPDSDEAKEAGAQLFESLHCAACHDDPSGTEANPGRISLKHVRQKFVSGKLLSFLKNPKANYAWSRMPDFKLEDDEAGQLAAFLSRAADKAEDELSAPDPNAIQRGKRLVQTSGCLNCHGLNLENQFPSKLLSDLPLRRWDQGCLAASIPGGSKAPAFGFTAAELEALRAFAASDRASLSRFVPAEFAAWQIENLRCLECHGKFEGFPPIEPLGGKLKPEWIGAFLGGRVPYKPRPWIPARMPAFGAWADGIGQGMAMLHGHPPHTPAPPPVDPEAAKMGQKLVSADGGFSCIACHAVGKVGATQVFESAGVNLAHAGERLQKDYYLRWLYNPLALEPGTKMPVYFDETGRSPLTDIYEGDGARQLNAIWQYLRLGDKMPPPLGLESAPQ